MSESLSAYEKSRQVAEAIEEHLRRRLPEVGVDGHIDIRPSRLGTCVRVRVIARKFDGMDVYDREDLVEPLIEELPEDHQSALTSLVLSGLREYEKPTSDDFLIRNQNEGFDQPLDDLLAPHISDSQTV